MNFPVRRLAVAVLLFAQCSFAAAQPAQSGNPSTNPAATPNLELTAAQKQTIYSSARNLNMKNETPSNFQPIVGANIPVDLELQPMPKTIAEIVPSTRDYQIVMISNQLVIADPQSHKVIEVIAGENN